MKALSKKKTLASLLAIVSVVVVAAVVSHSRRRHTHFDFVRFAGLAELTLDGRGPLGSGQAQVHQAPESESRSASGAALTGSSARQGAFYRIEGQRIPFRNRRTLFINRIPSSMQYHLKVPPEGILEFAFIAKGNSPSAQVVRASVRVDSESGREVSYSDRIVIEKAKNAKIRRFQKLDLSAVAGEICRFTFSLAPEQKLTPRVRVGWLDPRLTIRPKSRPAEGRTSRDSQAHLKKLRDLNQNSNLIIMLLDASNRNHLGTYGYERNTTPVIDGLGEQGVVFENAFCQSVYTISSTADLFTSTISLFHGVFNKGAKLSPDFATLPEVLRKNGFRTASFTASANSSSAFGFDHGFEEIHELFRVRRGKALLAESFIQPVTEWLKRKGKERFFLYLHFREPHLPLIAPEPFRTMFDPDYNGKMVGTFAVVNRINKGQLVAEPRDIDHLVALYDGNLAYVDYVAGQIVQKLKEMGLYENTAVLVLSDHGEALWEHGYQGHNVQVYDESIRIPAIFYFQCGDVPVRRRIDQIVRTIDMFPTILDLFGVDRRANPFSQGKSVLPYLFSEERDEDSMVLSHTGDYQDFSLRTDRYKYIWSGEEKEALYDLRSDQKETRNVIQEHPVPAGYLRFQLKKIMLDQQEKRRESGIKATETPRLDAETRENLKALGYVK